MPSKGIVEKRSNLWGIPRRKPKREVQHTPGKNYCNTKTKPTRLCPDIPPTQEDVRNMHNRELVWFAKEKKKLWATAELTRRAAEKVANSPPAPKESHKPDEKVAPADDGVAYGTLAPPAVDPSTNKSSSRDKDGNSKDIHENEPHDETFAMKYLEAIPTPVLLLSMTGVGYLTYEGAIPRGVGVVAVGTIGAVTVYKIYEQMQETPPTPN